MELWHGYSFLAITIRDYMQHTNQCLYNALVLKLAKQPESYLLAVRDSLVNIVRFIEDEVSERQARGVR